MSIQNRLPPDYYKRRQEARDAEGIPTKMQEMDDYFLARLTEVELLTPFNLRPRRDLEPLLGIEDSYAHERECFGSNPNPDCIYQPYKRT